MRILLLNDYSRPAGGAERIVATLRDALRASGHEVLLFASNAPAVDLAGLADVECFGTTSGWRTLVQCANPRAAAGLHRLLREFQPDVVHVNLYLTQLSPLILRVLRETPAVYYAQWYRAVCPKGTKTLPDGAACSFPAGTACWQQGCIPLRDAPALLAQGAMDRRWNGVFRRTAAISQAVAARLDEWGNPVLQNARVIPPGVPAVPPRTEMADFPLFVFAGRLVPEKGAETLLQAFARVFSEAPSARLILAGEGPLRTSLQALASALGLSHAVEFRGHLATSEVQDLVCRAWAVCVPSQWEEPFGFIAAEAQMAGVAVIASRTGGLTDIVEHGRTGWLCRPGDPDTLAEALLAAASDQRVTATAGRRGHERAISLFSAETFAARFLHLYAEAVS